MGLSKTIWASPEDYLRTHTPEHPVIFFAPAVLRQTVAGFLAGFPGLVTYAVKSNPDDAVIENLIASGIKGFDVASIAEMDLIRRLAPEGALHFNNPVRSLAEIRHAVKVGVASYAVDSHSELKKLTDYVPAEGVEIAVRFKLPVKGAAYDFGAKFGAAEETAVALLAEVAQRGYIPALTFHPGTQCNAPDAWASYIEAALRIAARAQVKIARLNVGGGFPSHRLNSEAPRLPEIFARISEVAAAAFGADMPALVCEPGRALVAESYSLATRVKAIRDDAHVFLNDGVYGALSELHLVGSIDRVAGFGPLALPRRGHPIPRTVFGPTCDSTDRLPGEIGVPSDLQDEDHLIFYGVGAYSTATATQFNGYGQISVMTVENHGGL